MTKSILISIGDEILIGQTINTNSSYLGQKLTELGYDILQVISVGDDEDEILHILEYAESKADFIHITGGLGPTHDDITRKCVCKFFDSQLVHSPEVLENIKKLFEKRGVKMAEVNKDQAMVPDKAKVLTNLLGTAPGFKFQKNGKTFYFTPGVPYEMKGIYENIIFPELKDYINSLGIFYKQINILTTGIMEATLYELFGNIDDIIEDCKLAFLPSLAGVKLRLSLRGNDEKYIDEKLKKVKDKIYSIAGKYIYAEEEILMEEIIAKLLTEKNKTLAVAESCTGGLIANRLTNISGSSNFFKYGVISYSNESKISLLNVNPETIQKFGAVSEETAKEMALGVRNLGQTDFGLAITGIMGPIGGTPQKPVGLVYIAVSDKNNVEAMKFQFGDQRIRNKERASQAALNFLRKKIINIIE